MGWEVRRRKRYYYRKARDPQTGRVCSIYCGSGIRGEIAAQHDAREQAERERQRMLANFQRSPQYKETLAIMLNERKL